MKFPIFEFPVCEQFPSQLVYDDEYQAAIFICNDNNVSSLLLVHIFDCIFIKQIEAE